MQDDIDAKDILYKELMRLKPDRAASGERQLDLLSDIRFLGEKVPKNAPVHFYAAKKLSAEIILVDEQNYRCWIAVQGNIFKVKQRSFN